MKTTAIDDVLLSFGMPLGDPVRSKMVEAARAELASLTPPTPEEVARDYETVLDGLQPRPAVPAWREFRETALARLRDWAAQGKALEADVTAIRDTAAESHKAFLAANSRAITAESERDAARQEAETLRTARDEWKATAMKEADEATSLRSKVAALEAERDEAMATSAELEKTARENHRKWTAAVSRAEAAERRVAEVRNAALEEAAGVELYWLSPGDKKAVAERILALKSKTPTSAPAGLLEAVGPWVNWMREVVSLYPETTSSVTLVARGGDHAFTLGEARALLAAYDAAKGGETPKHEATLGVGDGSGSLFVHGTYEAVKAAQTHVADARKYREACERALPLDGSLQRRFYEAVQPSMHEENLPSFAAWLLNLTLDTPPAGPGGGEPTPEGDATAAHNAEWMEVIAELEAAQDDSTEPTPEARDPDAAPRSVLVPMRTPDVPPLAPPEPAAPEVLWEGEGVRVLADGRLQDNLSSEGWRDSDRDRLTLDEIRSLAHALAETRRENARLKDEVKQHVRFQRSMTEAARDAARKAARKAAESMRELCLNTIWDRIKAGKDSLRECWDAILDLPLE